MNFFKKLFGKSSKNQNSDERHLPDEDSHEQLEKRALESLNDLPEEDRALFEKLMGKTSGNANTPELFKEELYQSLNRYYSAPELRIELNLTDGKGNTFAEHEAFNATFDEWKNIRSVWDRRSVLFHQWDQSEFSKLQKWQIVERFVKDRDAPKAVAFQKSDITREDFQDIRLIVALSKLYRVLDALPNALHYARGAFELRPDLDIVKVEYANTLHLSDTEEDRELSHKLMNEVIAEKIGPESDATEIPLLNYFVFSPGYIDSSVFAVSFLQAGNCDEETWGKLGEEYYWCPFFRLEHAVFLSKSGDGLRALAKLFALAEEFPWFKAGIQAGIDAINQLRAQNNDPDFMSEEMDKMEQYQSMWRQ